MYSSNYNFLTIPIVDYLICVSFCDKLTILSKTDQSVGNQFVIYLEG